METNVMRIEETPFCLQICGRVVSIAVTVKKRKREQRRVTAEFSLFALFLIQDRGYIRISC